MKEFGSPLKFFAPWAEVVENSKLGLPDEIEFQYLNSPIKGENAETKISVRWWKPHRLFVLKYTSRGDLRRVFFDYATGSNSESLRTPAELRSHLEALPDVIVPSDVENVNE